MTGSIHDMWYGKARTVRRPAQEILFTVGDDGKAQAVDPGVGRGTTARPVRGSVDFTAPYPGAQDNSGPGGIPMNGDVRGYSGAGVRGFAGVNPDEAVKLEGLVRLEAAARMQAGIVALRGALAIARARVVATPNATIGMIGAALATLILPGSSFASQILGATSPAATKEATLNGLKILEGLVNTQESKIPSVLDGGLPLSRWFAGTDPIRTGISDVLATLDEDSTASNLSATYDDVKGDLEAVWAKVEQVGGAAVSVVGTTYPLLIVGALALGGFVLYQYMTAPLKLMPKMNGFGKRTRRRRRSSRR